MLFVIFKFTSNLLIGPFKVLGLQFRFLPLEGQCCLVTCKNQVACTSLGTQAAVQQQLPRGFHACWDPRFG